MVNVPPSVQSSTTVSPAQEPRGPTVMVTPVQVVADSTMVTPNDPIQQITITEAEDGQVRAERFAAGWPRGSLSETVDRIAGPNAVISNTPTGKTIFANPETGLQVVYDTSGNYFRIQDTRATSRVERYRSLDGSVLSANVQETRRDGTTRERGRTSEEREQQTHFANTDE